MTSQSIPSAFANTQCDVEIRLIINYLKQSYIMKNMLHIIIALAVLSVSTSWGQPAWKQAYYRGVGISPYCANPTYTYDPLTRMCNSPCLTGYQLIGSLCYQNCPFYWTGTGTTCSNSMGGGLYGRGAGYFSTGSCVSGGDSWFDSALGCETWGLIIYPVCAPGYSYFGCCICTFNGGCPSPLTGGGPPCNKPFSPPPFTAFPICAPGLVFGATDGLCYPSCITGYSGDATCWLTTCPSSAPYTCNTALCTTNTACSGAETTATTSVLAAINTAIAGGATQFTVDAIVQAVGASAIAVGAGMCNQPTWASQTAATILPYTCNDRRFPIFLGSSTGSTHISTFQFDNLSPPNIGLGGTSTDTTLVSVSGAPFVGVLLAHGFSYQWVMEFSTLTQDIKQIAFNPTSTQLMVLFAGAPATLIIMSSATGAIISQVKDTTSQLSGTSMTALVDTSGLIILAAYSNGGGSLILIGMNLFNTAGLSFTSALVSSANQQIPYSADQDNLGNFYTASYATQLSISSFSYTIGVTPFAPTATGSYFSSASYVPNKMKYMSFPPSQSALFISADGIPANYGILLIKRSLSPTLSFESFIYTENTGDQLITVDILPLSYTSMYTLIKNTQRNTLTLLAISFNAGLSTISIQRQIQTFPALTANQVYAASIQSSGQYYLGGTITSYSSCMTIATGSVGFLAYTDTTFICGTSYFSQLLEASPTITPYSTVSYSSQPLTINSNTLNLANPGVTATSLTALYQTPNTCCLQTVNSYPSVVNHRYIIDYPTSIYPYTNFTYAALCTDLYIFSYTSTSAPVLPTPLPITFNNGGLSFTTVTSNAAFAGTYAISVTGVLPNHQTIVNAPTFVIQLFNIPPATTITSYKMQSQSYIVTDTQLNFTCQNYLQSDPTYYIIYYLQVLDPMTNTYTNNIDNEIFIFTQGGQSNNISVYTKNNTKKGVYQMQLMGKFTPNTAFQAVSTFTVTLMDQCYLTKLIPSSLPNSVVFTMTTPDPGPTVILFKEWKDTLGVCGGYNYKINMLNGLSTPSFIQFNSNLRQISIKQSSVMAPASYSIRLSGSLSNFFMSTSQFMNISINCMVGALKSPQQNQVINFISDSPAIIIQIQDFTQSPQCGSTLTYHANLADGSPLPQKYLAYTETTNSLGIVSRQISFQAASGGTITQFDVVVTAISSQGQKTVSGKLTIQFVVQDSSQFSETTYPALYIMVKAGTQEVVPFVNGGGSTLRLLQSSTALNITLSKQMVQLVSGALTGQSVTLVSSTEPSTSFDASSGSLVISPNQNDPQGTRYIVQAIIEDSKAAKFRITQNIFVIVYQTDASSVSIAQLKAQMLGLLQQTITQFAANSSNNSVVSIWDKAGINVTSGGDPSLIARIQQITSNGLVTVKFTKSLLVPQNFTLIDDTVLTLNITTGYQIDNRDLAFTWNTTFMSSNLLQIQLSFDEPIAISAYQIWDTLVITFGQPQFFITLQSDNKTFAPIQLNFQASKPIPRQLSSTDKQLSSASSTISTGVFSAIFGNFLIAIMLSSSLQSIWGLINVSQLLMLIPLFNINLPANVQTVFLYISNIINFNFVNVNNIPLYNWFFTFQDDQPDYDPNSPNTGTVYGQQFQTYSYSSFDMIENMGTSFISFVLMIVYQLALYLIWRFFDAIGWKVKYIENLQKSVYFNLNVRGLYEGSLGILIYAVINVSNYNFTSQTEIFSTAIAIISLIGLPSLLIYSLFVTRKVARLGHRGLKETERVNSIYEGTRTDNVHRLNYNAYYLLRRMLIVLMLIMLLNYPLLQIILFMGQSVVFSAYIAYWRPFEDPKTNNTEIFNESMLLLATQTLFVFTDFCGTFDPIAKYNFGWVLCGIMFLIIIVNLLLTTWDQLVELKSTIKMIYNRIRHFLRKRHAKEATIAIRPTDDTSMDIEEDRPTSAQQNLHRRRLLEKAARGFSTLFEIKTDLSRAPDNM